MYVDTSVEVDRADIERSAKEFEQRIYQRDRELFGQELSPGIDGDVRLTILNTPLQGAGGYFSSADGVVKAVNRFSNEREMFVTGINSYRLGSDGYLAAFVPIAARKHPDIKSFADIYADWAVANLLNDPAVADGRYV